MKKPKIVVVGAGNVGSILLENLSKNSDLDISYLSLADKFENSKFNNAKNVETINTSKAVKISLEDVKYYCNEFNKNEELKLLIKLMQEKDEVYKVFPTKQGCLQEINWMQIKLKRDSKNIFDFYLYDKNK